MAEVAWELRPPDRTLQRAGIASLLAGSLGVAGFSALLVPEYDAAWASLALGGLTLLATALWLRSVPPSFTASARVDGGILHIADERWPLESIGWATAEHGELVLFDVDGAILHDVVYEESEQVEALAAFVRASAPSHSTIEERRQAAARLHAEARKLTDRRG
ncbi:MAG: hypothetical protein EP330_13640 [Deltaproteobacteria bacterium]|nr:MAG: hypothetical protein EP330_13640 [Deltaproteobacteria bacterium]